MTSPRAAPTDPAVDPVSGPDGNEANGIRASRPVAILVSGAPGSGKSTVGSLVAGRLGAALLDLDTATASLTAVVGDLHGHDDLDDPSFAEVTRVARYEAITALAEDNLAAGVSVVLVAPFSAERRDPEAWGALTDRLHRAGGRTRLVWLRISAAEVRRRVGQRGAGRDSRKLDGDWAATLDLDAPTVAHLEVDAHSSPAMIAETVLSSLADETEG
jgi:predicted kinase